MHEQIFKNNWCQRCLYDGNMSESNSRSLSQTHQGHPLPPKSVTLHNLYVYIDSDLVLDYLVLMCQSDVIHFKNNCQVCLGRKINQVMCPFCSSDKAGKPWEMKKF